MASPLGATGGYFTDARPDEDLENDSPIIGVNNAVDVSLLEAVRHARVSEKLLPCSHSQEEWNPFFETSPDDTSLEVEVMVLVFAFSTHFVLSVALHPQCPGYIALLGTHVRRRRCDGLRCGQTI
jgi:hypothetical protein